MNKQQKLELLSQDSRFDLCCSCGTKYDNDHRQRTSEGLWLYPVSLPGGGTSVMLKTLLSNVCINDCLYCPLRNSNDIRRCTLDPEDVAKFFIDYLYNRKVIGLFLSSAVVRDPDYTMDRIIGVAQILRKKYQYRGYIHLKIIPGSSSAAIENAVSLSNKKNYDNDIVRPLKQICRLTGPETRYNKVKVSTQFIDVYQTLKNNEWNIEVVKEKTDKCINIGLILVE